MQFLESSYVGLRSAFHELESDIVKPKFLVLPMVHIGDKSFYDEVSRRLDDCQTIVYEGVPGFRTRLLTQAYRITAKKKSLNLTLQRDAIRINDQEARKVHADVTSEGFAANWRGLPWLQQIGLTILAPLYGIWTYMFSTRESLAKGRSTDSLSNSNALRKDDSAIAVRDVFLTKRDEFIVLQIDKYLDVYKNEGETVAILFGAGHMPAIVSHLTEKHGYSSKKAEWISAITVS